MTTTINTSSTGISYTTSFFSTFSATPISITGTTSQKTLLVSRIPASALSPNCKINLQFNFSRNKTGTSSISYTVALNDYWATSIGQGEQIVSTSSMATSSQDTRREIATIALGSDVRYQKFLQNSGATAGGLGNLNKVVDANFKGNVGVSIVIAATLGNAADVFTMEDYQIWVSK